MNLQAGSLDWAVLCSFGQMFWVPLGSVTGYGWPVLGLPRQILAGVVGAHQFFFTSLSPCSRLTWANFHINGSGAKLQVETEAFVIFLLGSSVLVFHRLKQVVWLHSTLKHSETHGKPSDGKGFKFIWKRPRHQECKIGSTQVSGLPHWITVCLPKSCCKGWMGLTIQVFKIVLDP